MPGLVDDAHAAAADLADDLVIGQQLAEPLQRHVDVHPRPLPGLGGPVEVVLQGGLGGDGLGDPPALRAFVEVSGQLVALSLVGE